MKIPWFFLWFLTQLQLYFHGGSLWFLMAICGYWPEKKLNHASILLLICLNRSLFLCNERKNPQVCIYISYNGCKPGANEHPLMRQKKHRRKYSKSSVWIQLTSQDQSRAILQVPGAAVGIVDLYCYGDYTLWLFNIAMGNGPQKKRFTELKNGGSFTMANCES